MPGDVGNRLGRIESKVTPGQKLMMGRHPPPFLESKKNRFQILCVSNGNTFFFRKIAQTKVFAIHKVLLEIFEDREFWRENNIRQI